MILPGSYQPGRGLLGAGLAIVLFCCPALSQAEDLKGEGARGSSGWRVRAGYAVSPGAQVEARWDGEALLKELDAFSRSESGGAYTIGPQNEYANRDYQDGFVYIDPGTADPDTEAAGLTWYWSYENSAQYDGDAVSFRGDTLSESRSRAVNAGTWSGEKEFDQSGVELSVERAIGHMGPVDIGLGIGMRWYESKDVRFSLEHDVGRSESTEYFYVDTYSATPTPFPDAPYSGTYDGPGYLINNKPDQRDVVLLSRESRSWIATSSLDAEIDSSDVYIGPTFDIALNERLVLRFMPQLLLAYVDAELISRTQVAGISSQDVVIAKRTSSGEWVPGLGLQIDARVGLSERWFLFIAASGQGWSDDVTLSAEPFEIDVLLGNWSASAGLGRAF